MRRTDSEIKNLYETRNNNPNLKRWQKQLVIEEAERRNNYLVYRNKEGK